MTVGSLFAGIGGFDLAAERVGWDVKWQVEIDDYCTKVLEKHWPHVRRYRDVRAIDWSAVEPVDLICGGFPCQPHSLAGRRLAAADDRDLWPEVVRCLRTLRPRRFVGENVSGLLSSDGGRFFGTVLRDLAESGFDAEWDCIPASAVGAPHQRDRVWIVADANRRRQQECPQFDGASFQDSADRDPRWRHVDGLRDAVADAARLQSQQGRERAGADTAGYSCAGAVSRRIQACAVLADTDSARPQERFVFTGIPGKARRDDNGQDAPLDSWWAVEPNVGRVAHGVPARVDRLRGLGNAIVPQVAEWIFRQIQAAEESAVTA